MKKLYFMLIALMCAIAANADDWYLTGANYGNWGDSETYKLSATTEEYVYKITVASLTGEFKIKKKGTWTDAIGGSGTAIQEGVWYQGIANSNNNLKVSGTIENATITVNVSTKKVLVEGEAKANEYTDVYLVGDLGSGWNESITTHPLKLKSGSTNVYEGTYELTAATSYFKMKAGTLIYGTGGNDIAVQLDKEYTASQSGNAFSLGVGKYTFTFVLNKNAATGKLTVTNAGKVEFPETIYVIGYVNDKEFLPNNTIAIPTTEDGIYEGAIEFTESPDAGYSYFQLCTATGSSNSDWAGLGVRYGAESKDFAVVAETAAKVVAGADLSWKIATGKYIMTVNLNDMTLVVAEDPTVGVNSIEADVNAPAEYFNLQGVRVAEPEKGLYIKRQGDKISKVMIRK